MIMNFLIDLYQKDQSVIKLKWFILWYFELLDFQVNCNHRWSSDRTVSTAARQKYKNISSRRSLFESKFIKYEGLGIWNFEEHTIRNLKNRNSFIIWKLMKLPFEGSYLACYTCFGHVLKTGLQFHEGPFKNFCKNKPCPQHWKQFH